MKPQTILGIAALNGFVATGLAAIGSHMIAFEGNDASLFQQAIDFHYIHILALAACAFFGQWHSNAWSTRAAILFMMGIVGFSFSLYWRAIMGSGSLGSFHWITPIGGLSLMAGWLCLSVGAFTARSKD